jgi:hypothetical protein
MPRSTTNNTTPGNLTKLATGNRPCSTTTEAKMERLRRSRAVARPLDGDWAETEAVCPGLFPSHRQTGSQLM